MSRCCRRTGASWRGTRPTAGSWLLDLERRIPARDRFAPDSPLEEERFEPLVPGTRKRRTEGAILCCVFANADRMSFGEGAAAEVLQLSAAGIRHDGPPEPPRAKPDDRQREERFYGAGGDEMARWACSPSAAKASPAPAPKPAVPATSTASQPSAPSRPIPRRRRQRHPPVIGGGLVIASRSLVAALKDQLAAWVRIADSFDSLSELHKPALVRQLAAH
jgi:hypothetical protein